MVEQPDGPHRALSAPYDRIMAVPKPSPNSTALVTGASSGIGVEIARVLAARGHGLTLVARRREELEALAADIGESVRIEVLPADLSDADERAALPDRVADLGLQVGMLVNNAGLSTFGPVARSTPAAEVNMVEVNVTAVVDLTTRFLPGMVERGGGAILNVASMAAFQPLPGQSGYAATKAFVLSYSQGLTGELRGTGVSVTALCPGPVRTGFAEAAGISDDMAAASFPSFMWESAEQVAEAGVAALLSGHPTAIPGLANRATALLGRFTPRSVLVPVLSSMHPGLKSRRRD